MNILLSILIPAYEYAEGVEKILSNLRLSESDSFEIIVSDDSINDSVSQLVSSYTSFYHNKLRYIRNKPKLGAVPNWNQLIDQASGKYVILLHHDEYPLEYNFIHKVLTSIKSRPDIDVFVMDCILASSTSCYSRPHFPRNFRILVLKYFPSYLFKRNVIGPASCLIVRRAIYSRFDDRLRWLVDVDAYYRLRQITSSWLICNDLRIGSALNRRDSITASIKKELTELDMKERVYLSHKYPNVTTWLKPRKYLVINTLEDLAWKVMRVTTRIFYGAIHCFKLISISMVNFSKKSKNDHM